MSRVRRVDLIREYLSEQPGTRARVNAIAAFIGGKEGRDDVSGPAISVAVRQENQRLESVGEPLAEDAEAEFNGDRVESSGRRLRIETLGDPERGLSVEEIAQITGVQVQSVRTYLCVPDRKKALFDRIRSHYRDEALEIVAKKRGRGDQ